jgi:catalase
MFRRYVSAACSVAALLMSSGNAAAQTSSAERQVGEGLVSDIHSAFGVHPARAVHAKGVILEGVFQAAPGARDLSKAALFDGKSRAVTVRVSDFTGFPDISDGSPDASPYGFGLKVHMVSERDYDVVAHSFNGFPVATAAEFGALMRAIGESRTATAHPTPLERFLDAHPAAKVFVSTQKPPPASYAATAYFGVNAFRFTNARGQSAFVRYRFVPVDAERYLTPAEAKAQGPDYLKAEIGRRLAAHPVAFIWYAQVATPADSIADPSIPWPETRRLVELGVVTLKAVAADPAATDQALIFLPGRTPDGIAPADPMLTIRNAAYAVSFEGRQAP